MRSNSTFRAALPALLLTAAACSSPAPSRPLRLAEPRPLPAAAGLPSSAEGASGAAAQAEASDLDALIALAQQRHPAVSAAMRRWESALERVPQVEALPEPQLALTAWVMPAETRSGPMLARVMLSQGLPWPGRLDAAAREALEAAGAEAEEVRAAMLQVEADARSAWTDLVYLAHARAITGAHLELLRGIEAAARARYASGGAGYADVIRLQVEIGMLIDRLAELDQQRAPRTARLAAALDAPAPELDWAAQEWPFRELPAAEELAAQARRDAPEARRARAMARAAAAGHERARLEAKPDFMVAAEYTVVGADGVPGFDARGDDDLMVTLGMDLAVRRDAYSAAMRQALADGGAAREQERAVLLRLDADLAEHGFRLNDAERRISLYRDSLLPKADEAVGAALSAYEAGTTGFQELLDATRVVLEFRLSLERAHADRSLAWAELARLGSLSLAVPEQR